MSTHHFARLFRQMFDMITREALRLKLLQTEKLRTTQSGTVKLHPVSGVKTKSKGKCCGGGGNSISSK